MILLMCRSGQSSITIVANSGSPLNSTSIIAGLNPVTRGPSCKKVWANILPATRKRLLSISTSDVAGTRWSGSPSNSSVQPIPPRSTKKAEFSLFYFFKFASALCKTGFSKLSQALKQGE